MDLKMTGYGTQKQANLTETMKRRMNYLIARQGIVAGNVANASTPGYISQDLSFAGEVRRAGINLDTTHIKHIEGQNSSVKSLGKMTYDKSHMREDGNSVKLDEEMLKLNDIQMNYRLITRLYSKHASMHRLALQGNR
jgi:flagellar basal-body rod protein FlgB